MRTSIFTVLSIFFVSSTLARNHFTGLTASNSIGGSATYDCRTQAQWNQLATDAKGQGFAAIRIEGFDCDALDRASAAANATGLQVLAGIWVSGTIAQGLVQINNDVQTFKAAYEKYGPSRYLGLTIGNEVADSASNIMIKEKQGYLGSVGVSTPVSTVHTWVTVRDNPALCGADFAGANAHAFYDGNFLSNQTGDFISEHVVPALKSACPGKKIYITESGWPSRGSNNQRAVASVADERSAIVNLNRAAGDNPDVSVFAFEYDDQLWKNSQGEQSFGIFGKVEDALSV